MAKLKGSKNLDFLVSNFSFDKAKSQEKQGFVLEGGSGSAKTYDTLQFIMFYCEVNRDKNKDILIFRNQFSDLKKTTLKDFIKILKMYEIYDDKCYRKSQPTSYDLFGNIIYFSGLDNMGSHGERHDLIYGNEGIELDFDSFRQLNQRCNEAFIIDYNPSETQHWIYDNIIPRPDTLFLKTTLLDNPFLPLGQRNEILSYEPTAENIENGTADDFMWKVYGLGERGINKGTIFKYVTWLDEFPKHLNNFASYGVDFGFTNDPTAICKMAIDGKNLYLQGLCYEPIESSYILSEVMSNLGINKWDLTSCDSADKYDGTYMVRELRDLGWNISKVDKSKGIRHSIGLLKGYKIHIVSDSNWLTEQRNYKWREINGKLVNEPVDKFNHYWDSARYNLIGYLRNNINFEVKYS